MSDYIRTRACIQVSATEWVQLEKSETGVGFADVEDVHRIGRRNLLCYLDGELPRPAGGIVSRCRPTVGDVRTPR